MTQEKIDKLEEIGFDTRCESSKVRQEQRQRSMIKAEVKWEENFDALVAYKQLFGTTEVNEKMGDEGEYKKLAGWVGLQRCVSILIGVFLHSDIVSPTQLHTLP